MDRLLGKLLNGMVYCGDTCWTAVALWESQQETRFVAEIFATLDSLHLPVELQETILSYLNLPQVQSNKIHQILDKDDDNLWHWIPATFIDVLLFLAGILVLLLFVGVI